MTISTFGATGPQYGTTGSPRDQLVPLLVQFVNPSTRQAVDVVGPAVRFQHDGQAVSVQAVGSVEQPDRSYPLVANVPAQTGLYRIAILTSMMAPGLYDLEFTGQSSIDGQTVTLLVKGQIGVGSVSIVDDLIVRLRSALMDDIVEQYQLDRPIHQWNLDQLYVYLRESVGEINATGPRLTAWSLDDTGFMPDTLVVDGARIRALQARARFERANEMDYSDQHTLSIKRADFYLQMAQQLGEVWRKLVESFKRASPPRTIALRSQRTPFRISRVIGLLPNFSSYFPG